MFHAHDPLEVMGKFLLNASFNSLLSRHHGVKDNTGFNLVSITIESTQVAAQVRTQHESSVEIHGTVQEFDDMLFHSLEEYSDWEPCQYNKTDEIPSKRARYDEFIAEILRPNIGRSTPYKQSSVESRTIQCWCCPREITYGVIVKAAADEPTPIVGLRKRSVSASGEAQKSEKIPKCEGPYDVTE